MRRFLIGFLLSRFCGAVKAPDAPDTSDLFLWQRHFNGLLFWDKTRGPFSVGEKPNAIPALLRTEGSILFRDATCEGRCDADCNDNALSSFQALARCLAAASGSDDAASEAAPSTTAHSPASPSNAASPRGRNGETARALEERALVKARGWLIVPSQNACGTSLLREPHYGFELLVADPFTTPTSTSSASTSSASGGGRATESSAGSRVPSMSRLSTLSTTSDLGSGALGWRVEAQSLYLDQVRLSPGCENLFFWTRPIREDAARMGCYSIGTDGAKLSFSQTADGTTIAAIDEPFELTQENLRWIFSATPGSSSKTSHPQAIKRDDLGVGRPSMESTAHDGSKIRSNCDGPGCDPANGFVKWLVAQNILDGDIIGPRTDPRDRSDPANAYAWTWADENDRSCFFTGQFWNNIAIAVEREWLF